MLFLAIRGISDAVGRSSIFPAAPDEEKFYEEGAKEVEEEIQELKGR